MKRTRGSIVAVGIALLAAVRPAASEENPPPSNPAARIAQRHRFLLYDTIFHEQVNKQRRALMFYLDLAMRLNPVVGFWDPLNIVNENTAPETIGWFRHAEIKHGRVAMAGFVGYLVHAKGITWGFPMTMQGDKWPELGDGGVAALWDNLKAGGKWQIIGFVGCLEFWRELQTYETAGKRDAHYMRGGLPGKYPDFEGPLPNLYWGLGAGKKTPEQLAKGRNAEINNGRLAMLGLFGFFAESKAPGSVPFLTQFDFPAYGGDFMQPFEGNFELFGGN